MRARVEQQKKKSVVVIGAGGNIGSHLVPHLGRMPNVGRVTLIDRDVYEPANLLSQDITRADVGRRKAVIQARRLSRINADLTVKSITEDVERVPLGNLRADVMLACLDSRRARAYVNQAAWRLGQSWIDTGVEAGGLLARVNVYMPSAESACLECSWDDQDYRQIEQVYPCAKFAEPAFPTNAPSSLGALAASLQAIECAKILSGQVEQAAVNQQVLIAATHHKLYVTNYRRNPDCRLGDHEPWRITPLKHGPRALNIGRVIALGKSPPGVKDSFGLRVAGIPFVNRLTCIACGRSQRTMRLQNRLRKSEETCRQCGGKLIAAGRDLIERLEVEKLPAGMLARSLHSLGFRAGDVFSIGNRTAEQHFEIGVEGG
jgi:molybdopterin/thiamine biosynthesis adenylyltransferase